MARVARTIVVETPPIPRRLFRVFAELEGMYRNMVEQLVLHAVREGVPSFTRLKALKYRELRSLYPQLPSHYAYTACQDASARAKSFLRLKKKGLVEREHPEVDSVSIWLDDHLWRANGLTSIEVATHNGWIPLEVIPHKQYWKYVNKGWRLASEAKIKLDRKSRKLLVYLTFAKEVEEYKPRGYVSVDVNEDNVTVLIDGVAYLFETNMKRVVLGYYYRRKRVQEKYDVVYGTNFSRKKRILRKLKEKKKKDDARWKIASIIVREAFKRRYAIVMEKLGKRPGEKMVSRIRDSQLRHRVFQASFKGVQRAIEEKAREYGVPVIYVDPKNTSRLCPVHGSKIVYGDESRIGKCERGGEIWHRDVVAVWNLLLKTLRGGGSSAPSPAGLPVDGSPVPLGSTAAHEPTVIARDLWARWKSLEATLNDPKKHRTAL
ncbi:IS element ISDka1 orfB, putative transposase [Desulfurococcus amylolyticus 1221n]|uniref:IS element ISDka1 orfB, putative transposase n=1 Tax=Desulfurococcus amylolyticus (strain DSM 18924 / JCM 16383 / VKM B-2413 / 1221n) TaxID=490899 RepID=B8D6R9_DESA1|nr:RNA-guided endonuclease TnpB family protein [Desulfurococcus amylolyticus]ACL11800.1 IS element ISDka1 orfB, putative transposase [Desulfurococcus amylolyticus 1221n]